MSKRVNNDKGKLYLKTEKHIPVVCPVCGGSGLVPNDFYKEFEGFNGTIAYSNTKVKCRSCSGTGVILQFEEHCNMIINQEDEQQPNLLFNNVRYEDYKNFVAIITEFLDDLAFEDRSVGIHGMTDGEKVLADSVVDFLKQYRG